MTAALAVAVTAGAAFAGSAAAAGPTAPYTDFKYCPYTNTDVTSCVYSETTSGTFTLGNASVPINKKIVLQGGFRPRPGDPSQYDFYNAVGAKTLSEVPLDVPGGLTGLVVPQAIRDIPLLGPIFDAAVNAVNGVTATAELVGPVGFNFANYNSTTGVAITLPLRVHLENPFLGGSCYIGDAGDPLTLNLTTGTTAPHAPNVPITGSRGVLSFPPYGLKETGYSLVDNDMRAPAAHDCGPWGFQWAVTPIVNLKEGLPAAAGKNTAIMSGDLGVAGAARVRASVQ